MRTSIFERIVVLPLFWGKEYYRLSTTIIDKQVNCGKYHFNAKSLGVTHNIVKICNLLTCTSCYNHKLFKLQKDIVLALKHIIKESRICSILENFIPSKENSLIKWIEENKPFLDIELSDFKVIFSNLSSINVNPENTFKAINNLKKYSKLVYDNLNNRLGEFTLFDFKPDKKNKINVHSHTIIFLDKNIIYTSYGRDLRYNSDIKIKSILSMVGYNEESKTDWVKTYYDLFRIIAYITKPRPLGFEDNIDALSWLHVAISIYDNNGEMRHFRNYTMTGILNKKRSENNKEFKQNKLLRELKTPMVVKKGDFIRTEKFEKKLFLDKVKKETDYSINNTGYIIFPRSDNDNLYQYIELYKKRPDVFMKVNEELDNTRFQAILRKSRLSVSKIKNLSITTRDDIECIDGQFKQVKLVKRKSGKYQKVYHLL